MPLTRELARFVAGVRFEDLPAAALPWIGTAFADTVGTLLAGRGEPLVARLRQALAPAGGESDLLFGRGTARPLDAAFLNATAAHALDYDDAAHRGHISTVVVPALLAEADVLGSDGRLLCAAYAAGYEVFAELMGREQDHYHNHSWHPTGVMGSVAAAAACAVLRGLDETRTLHALAIAASQSSGLIASFGSDTKPLHAGRAAHAGVLAAALAEQGFTGATEALEHPKGLLRGVSPAGRVDLASAATAGAPWKIARDGVNIKKFPVCFAGHRCIDAMLELVARHRLTPAGVRAITVSTSRRNRATLRYPQPASVVEAKFSMEFAIAAALVAGRVSLLELGDAFLARQDLRQAMQLVTVAPDDTEDPLRPGEAPVDSVQVVLADGSVLQHGVAYARGTSAVPLAREELFAKFEGCAQYGGVRGDARPLFDALFDLSRVGGTRELRALAGA